MKKTNGVWKLVLFTAMLALMVGLCAAASAENCAPGTHKWYYDYNPIPSDNYPCGATFSITDHCTVAGCSEIWERTIKISDHKAGTPVVTIREATCVAEGQRTTTTYCTRCTKEMSHTTETIPALGHDFGDWVVNVKPTCEGSGNDIRTCRRCGLTETRSTAPIGHDWGEWVVTTAPTCEGKGQQTKTCRNDSSHKQYQDVDPIGHKWGPGVVTKQPTCTSEGVTTYTCQNDPNHTKNESIPVVPTAHQWDNGRVTTAPNCTNPGVITYTCALNSSHTYTESIPVDPNAHDWDGGKVSVPADCETPGTLLYTCKINPAHTRTETIPATGHKWDKGTVTVPATNNSTGIRHYVCENNSAHTKDEIIPKVVMSNNTICAFGPRLRDMNLYPYNTDVWYMFTPFDASVDGRQTYELVASNKYIVGSLTMTIRDGKLTVDYTLNSKTINITLEFFTILPQLKDIHIYEPEQLLSMNMKVRTPIDLQEKFGDDRNLVLYFCSRCDYTYSNNFVDLDYNSTAHQRLLNEMLNRMDK